MTSSHRVHIITMMETPVQDSTVTSTTYPTYLVDNNYNDHIPIQQNTVSSTIPLENRDSIEAIERLLDEDL